MKRIKLVSFQNGNYAVRRGLFSYTYYDKNGFWRSKESLKFKDCLMDRETAIYCYNLYKREKVIL